ncbi:hypothetical protein ACIRTB_12040 [Streptomyces sp. NPDC101158]|uniref:hypothetical protein n=1 Tax=Streptomyces sp. NPDC101158 TaxID=3366117 RepID=UPI0037F3730B
MAGETGTESLSCPSSGNITNWDKCTTLSNGFLMINEATRGDFVGHTYWKSGCSAITARLGFLRAGASTWAGWRSMGSGLEYYNSWSGLSNGCYPTNGLLNTNGGATYQTPAADAC